jgi:hypothetical protein
LSSTPCPTSSHRAELFASAEQAPAGHLVSLEWNVVDSEGGVASVQFASATESGLEMIESVPDQGLRQIIFARPGLFTFTLTAVFRDGVRRSKQIHIRVTG